MQLWGANAWERLARRGGEVVNTAHTRGAERSAGRATSLRDLAMNYLDNRSHFQHVLANLRRLIPWVLGAALIFMGLKMAFATWVGLN
jgi:hypothetical protein